MALINDFLSLIYPRSCEACGLNLFSHERFICNRCRVSLPKSNYHLRDEHELGFVFAGRVPVVRACSFYTYEKQGRVQRLLHAIKYHGQKELAQYLGELYASELAQAKSLDPVDVLLPIPLHRNKLKARGFNQSEWFAKGLALGLNKTMDTGRLFRRVETSTQTRKRKYQRWENVEGIFAVDRADAIRNRHVLLVDDVITTGATLEAAWLALKEIEGVRVSVASIAFATRSI
jgi:ComF family protein